MSDVCCVKHFSLVALSAICVCFNFKAGAQVLTHHKSPQRRTSRGENDGSVLDSCRVPLAVVLSWWAGTLKLGHAFPQSIFVQYLRLRLKKFELHIWGYSILRWSHCPSFEIYDKYNVNINFLYPGFSMTLCKLCSLHWLRLHGCKNSDKTIIRSDAFRSFSLVLFCTLFSCVAYALVWKSRRN